MSIIPSNRTRANRSPRDQHGHLDYPPAAGKFFELPAGGTAMSQLACNRGATKWWRGSESNIDLRSGDYDFPCPGGNVTQFHVSLFRTLMDRMTADLPPLGVTEYVMRYLLFFAQIDLTFQHFL